MDVYGLEEGIIITEEESDTLVIDGKTIHIMPAGDWLLAMGEH
jgi:predicted AAA+ superfamily ATPase